MNALTEIEKDEIFNTALRRGAGQHSRVATELGGAIENMTRAEVTLAARLFEIERGVRVRTATEIPPLHLVLAYKIGRDGLVSEIVELLKRVDEVR